MNPEVLVATRDNPVALSALLASIIAGTDPAEVRNQKIHISDASREPVIFHPQVCRYLPLLDVHYRHTVEPNVNVQRLSLLKDIDDATPVLSVDDDLVLLAGHLRACRSEATLVSAGQTFFGTTVDATNERGYPDYEVFGLSGHDNHSFDVEDKTVECPALQQFSASVGHMLVRASEFHRWLNAAMLHGYHPAIEDDACATLLARRGTPLFHTAMRAWHVGNSNNWFSKGQWNDKRHAVRELVQTVEAATGDGMKES